MPELYMLPYAGGSSLSYSRWCFDERVKVVSLDYRGHGTRMKEELDKNFEDVVQDIYEQICTQSEEQNISIFGHSMGSLVAWEVAERLKEDGIGLKSLFVSACVPPHKFDFQYYNLLVTEEGLIEFLRKENRIRENQLRSTIFKDIVCPASINDYRLLSLYRKKAWQKINCPIICLYGLQDEMINTKDMKYWSEYTDNKCELREFQGSHYYIEDARNLTEIEQIVSELVLS